MRARLILDVPRPPAWNMAVDEALFHRASAEQPLTLRRAEWAEPAATLGRFQRFESFVIAGAMRPSIRRITGGGAILHAGECTISAAAAAPCTAFPDVAARALALSAATALEAALCGIGRGAAALHVRGGVDDEKAQKAMADCFQRRSPYDLVIDERGEEIKVAGIALHRGRGRILVQGSILRDRIGLARSDDGRVFEAWARALGATATERIELSADIEAAAARLVDTRYGRDEWNQRIAPARPGGGALVAP